MTIRLKRSTSTPWLMMLVATVGVEVALFAPCRRIFHSTNYVCNGGKRRITGEKLRVEVPRVSRP